MVARIHRATFDASHTPEPISSDPDDVRLALETARAFEAMGQSREVLEWLERAAERAARAGQHERAFELTQRMVSFANPNAFSGATPSTASSPPPSSSVANRGLVRSLAAELPPPPSLGAGVPSAAPVARVSSLLPPPRKSHPAPARKSSLPPVPMPSAPPPARILRDVSAPKGPPRAPLPAKRSPRPCAAVPSAGRSSAPPADPARASLRAAPLVVPAEPVNVEASIFVDELPNDRTLRVNTIRVAVARSASDGRSFTVEKLEKGQPLPAGAREATLVFSDDA